MKQKLLKIIQVNVPIIFYFGEISKMWELKNLYFGLFIEI